MYILFSLLFACSSNEVVHSTTPKVPEEHQEQTEASGPKVIIVGDSLTAGLGLSADSAYPTVLTGLMREADLPTQIINAGVSGDTTAGGLRRIDWVISQGPDLILIELGANDGLRGIPITEVTSNLNEMIDKVQNAGIDVMLVGMQIPPNYGKEYAKQFKEVFPQVAQEQGVPLLPFLLKDVAGVRDLNQPDGIHPTAKGHKSWRKPFMTFFVLGDLNGQSKTIIHQIKCRSTIRTIIQWRCQPKVISSIFVHVTG